MIPVEELSPESPGGGAGGVEGWGGRSEADRAWQRDVALEMWIDATTRPVSIRLAGVLDASTGANLVHVVEDCLDEGMREFALDTGGLVIDRSGRQVVDTVAEHVRHAGGRLRVDPASP